MCIRKRTCCFAAQDLDLPIWADACGQQQGVRAAQSSTGRASKLPSTSCPNSASTVHSWVLHGHGWRKHTCHSPAPDLPKPSAVGHVGCPVPRGQRWPGRHQHSPPQSPSGPTRSAADHSCESRPHCQILCGASCTTTHTYKNTKEERKPPCTKPPHLHTLPIYLKYSA